MLGYKTVTYILLRYEYVIYCYSIYQIVTKKKRGGILFLKLSGFCNNRVNRTGYENSAWHGRNCEQKARPKPPQNPFQALLYARNRTPPV
jgi:hypothetical protein